MKMDDNELKRLLQEGMEYEADRIMAEVESDPSMKDVVAPEEVYIKLKQQIREHQEEEELDRESRAKEDEELIRLGKIYKKKRSRRKYYILLVAVLCALGVGTVSFGDGKKVFTKISRMLGDRKQTVVNTDNGDDDKFKPRDVLDEEEAYEQINETFGFWPVRLYYMPEGIDFAEIVIEEEKQSARMYYAGEPGKSISYRIVTNYREGSVATDIEDVLLQEDEKEVQEVKISISKYQVEENHSFRWVARFTYENAQYSIMFMGMDENQVEKVIENLYFS